MTEAEIRLWEHLKNKQIFNLRFRRQRPIHIFIADFYCHQVKLVIEVDGDIHLMKENKEWDEGRTAEIERFGINIIKFTNQQVITDIGKVIEEIKKVCETLLGRSEKLLSPE